MGAMESEIIEEKILSALSKSSNGLSLEDIGDITGLSRPTVSKYVSLLDGKDAVDVRKWGTMKVVTLNNKER